MEFEVGDLMTAAATSHNVVYKVVSIRVDKTGSKRLTIAVEDSPGDWGALNGEYNCELFTLSYATKVCKEDVAYYEAITQEQERTER